MNERPLRYFMAAYETGSVSAAARRCHVAQPSISMALNNLEEQLGVSLFERHSRGVRPTHEGERFYPLAARMLADREAVVRAFRKTSTPQPLRLGLMRSLGATRMSGWLKTLLQHQPDLALTLVNPEEACDARIITENLAAPHDHFEPIWRDHYLLALPVGHPLSLHDSLCLPDLHDQPFIRRDHCPATADLLQRLLENGQDVQVRANLRTIEYTLGLVAAGVGLALVPDWPEIRQHPDLRVRPLQDWSAQVQIGLTYATELLPGVQDALLKACRESRANDLP